MSRIPAIQTERVCKFCSGKVFPGEARCKCSRVGGFAAKPNRPLGKPIPAPPCSMNAAHFRALVQSIRSGSWANVGYRAPKNQYREDLNRVYQELGGSFQ